MILETDEIKALIKKDKPDYIQEAQEKQKILNVHVNNRGTVEYLDKIENYENEAQYTLRKKYAIGNKFLTNNILRPVDKVFSAKGGSRVIQIEGEESEKTFKKQLNDVRFGMPIRRWIQNIQSNKFYSDPAGFVMIEHKLDEEDKPTAYPTLKSIQSVHCYYTEGRTLEYVVFEGKHKIKPDGSKSEEKYYRVVDDSYDYVFVKKGDDIREVEDLRKENPWGKVPAIINSNILNDTNLYSDSPLDQIVDLMDKYLRNNSVKSIYEFLHGFPLFWQYIKECKSCKGTGKINDDKTCTSCKGTGAQLKKDVSDVLFLNTPKNSESKVLAPDVAGYVIPPMEVPEEQRTELKFLFDIMMFTLWGTTHEKGDNPTATAAYLNVQPKNDALESFSEAYEDMEEKLTDLLGQFYYTTNYKGSVVRYGRRYLIESPDQIWNRYQESKEKGAPITVLNFQYDQYIQSEFKNDPQMYGMMKKLMMIEPFFHYTIAEVQGFNISQEEMNRKIWFGEWSVQKSEEEIIKTTTDKLMKEFDSYVADKSGQEE